MAAGFGDPGCRERPLGHLAAAIPGATVNIGVPHAERTLVVGSIRGETEDVIPLGAGVLFPRGSTPDRVWVTYRAWPSIPPRYSAPEWKRLVNEVRDMGLGRVS